MKHDKEALAASWKRRSCQDLKAAELLVSEEGMQVAGRYPESDQWIDDCNPSEWMAIVQ